MIDLEEFQRRVDSYFQCGQKSEPQGRIILDMMRALREASADIATLSSSLTMTAAENKTLKDAYLRLMRGVEERAKK